MKSVYLLSAVRTAVGSYLKSLKTIPPEELASVVLRECVRRSNVSADLVDGIIMGNVLSPSPNIARIVGLMAGFNEKIPAYTVNLLCASSLQAVISACQSLLVGDSNLVIAGGVESMSQAPYILPEFVRYEGINNKNVCLIDLFQYSSINAQPSKIFPGLNMGLTAENIVSKYNIGRYEQDLYAFESQNRYNVAYNSNYFADEIVPIYVQGKNEDFVFNEDESPRLNITMDKLNTLKPAFKKDGTVTAGNSCPQNDGASAVILSNETICNKYGYVPVARIVSYSVTGISPNYMGLGVVPAINKALELAKMSLGDIDLIEINEAFASQVIGCLIELNAYNNEIMRKLNISGGAIAMGHALANSGTRMLTTLMTNLMRLKLKYGLVSMCVGGGQGVAIIIEML